MGPSQIGLKIHPDYSEGRDIQAGDDDLEEVSHRGLKRADTNTSQKRTPVYSTLSN